MIRKIKKAIRKVINIFEFIIGIALIIICHKQIQKLAEEEYEQDL